MLGITDYPTFVGAVILFLAMPGPGNLALLTSTAQGGLRGGLASCAGIIAGDQVLMWAAVAGLSAVLLASPAWFGAVQWLGAAYLGYLGIRMLMAKDGDAPLLDMRSGRFFRQSFFITLFNPKAIVFYMAFFPLFVDSQQPPALGTFSFMAVTIAALTFLYSLSLSLLATRLRSRMQQSPWFGAGLHKLAGALLVGFGLRLIFQK
jgi:threonine/homoserine/homoserine lactone efflux protein